MEDLRLPNPRFAGIFSPVGVLLLVLLCCFCGSAFADSQGDPESASSGGEGELFSELLGNSPFLRRVDLSRDLALTGIADIEGTQVAILVDRETKETHFVSEDRNENGWRLIGIEGDLDDMESVSARLAVGGGEEISIAYDARQISPEGQVGLEVPRDQMRSVSHEARNFKRGISADGYPNPPPREVIERFSKLSEGQRMRIIYEMRQHSAKGKGTRERQRIFDGLVDRALRQRR